MPIQPPTTDPAPKWAQVLVNAANGRNRMRGHAGAPVEFYSMVDLVTAWKECGGRCAVSGLPFDLQKVGDGQAKRPFAPSLDRINRHNPYRRDNVRLVVSIANFAMNAWGLPPLLQLATSVHAKHGDISAPTSRAPSDADLDEIAAIDQELVETNVGTLAFPPRPDLYEPILGLLRGGSKSSREIEDDVARRFGVTREMRTALLRSGCPAWRNQVAWALVDLGTNQRGTGQIKRIRGCRAPDGGSMGIYCLTPEAGRDD
jgi:hypothetical protein